MFRCSCYLHCKLAIVFHHLHDNCRLVYSLLFTNSLLLIIVYGVFAFGYTSSFNASIQDFMLFYWIVLNRANFRTELLSSSWIILYLCLLFSIYLLFCIRFQMILIFFVLRLPFITKIFFWCIYRLSFTFHVFLFLHFLNSFMLFTFNFFRFSSFIG